jgi:maleate isomerase
MSEQFPQSVDLLMHAKLDALCYACTGASFLRGFGFDMAFMGETSRRVGKPVISMAGALVDAARHLGLQRIAVAAPYEQWLLDLLVRYLEEADFVVAKAVGLGHQANVLHTPEMAIDLALRAWTPDCEGLILSCGNFRSLEVIPEIELRLDLPVLTSNNSALWSLLSSTNSHHPIPNCGRILDKVRGFN